MTPEQILAHLDSGELWPADHGVAADGDFVRAYALALQVRALRERRGERVAGYKIGWTNRANWEKMGVSAPMWGTLHDTTVVLCDGQARVALGTATMPRLEPEVVLGLARAPAPGASLDELFACLDWIAPGFEIVSTHVADWRYALAENIADSAVHNRLVVGSKIPVASIARDGESFSARLASAGVSLRVDDVARATGQGANVLGSPLLALHRFIAQMRAIAGSTPLKAGDIVTTGTWTDAQDITPGQAWEAAFDAPIGSVRIALE